MPALFADAVSITPEGVLVTALLGGSIVAWSWVLGLGTGSNSDEAPAAERPTSFPWWPLGLTILWLAMSATGAVTADAEVQRPQATPNTVAANAAIGAGLVATLLLLLRSGESAGLARFGISLRNWPRQIALGLIGLLLAIGPVFLSLAATAAWRSKETQHSFLQLLSNHPPLDVLVLMLATVCVIAPLSEELMFRVILQGWLRTRLDRWPAIFITAVIFALVHGWRDSLPLLPLALILGWLFDRQQSYLAVVTTHSLFNGAMLTLAFLTRD